MRVLRLLQMGLLLPILAVALTGCLTVDLPWIENPGDAKLMVECKGCQPGALAGPPPLMVVFWVENPSADVSYTISIFAEGDRLLYEKKALAATYTFNSPGIYKVTLSAHGTQIASEHILVLASADDEVVWRGGRFFMVGILAPTEVTLGQDFAIKVYIKVLVENAEFFYLDVIGYNAVRIKGNKYEAVVNQPHKSIYQVSLMGFTITEGKGVIRAIVQGGPTGESDKVEIEVLLKVIKP